MSLAQYRKLEERLREHRRHHPEGCDGEDAIIDDMVEEWWLLTDEERDVLDDEGPTCREDLDEFAWMYRGLRRKDYTESDAEFRDRVLGTFRYARGYRSDDMGGKPNLRMETDAEFRERIKALGDCHACCTLAAIEAAALSCDGITEAEVVEEWETWKVDPVGLDRRRGEGYPRLVVMVNADAHWRALDDAQTAIDDVRAAGVLVEVRRKEEA